MSMFREYDFQDFMLLLLLQMCHYIGQKGMPEGEGVA